MTSITARSDEIELLRAFLPNDLKTAPRTLLIQGNPATGKTLTLRHYLKSIKVNHSFIECDQCLSTKILWKRVMSSLQRDSGLIKGSRIENESQVTSSFQGFLKSLKDFLRKHKYRKLHYIVLDRADQVMEDGEELFTNFSRIQESLQVENISVIFVTSPVMPRRLITLSVPTIFFTNYSNKDTVEILVRNKLCQFPESLLISQSAEDLFWENYVNLIVDSYFTFTTNITLLRRILIRLWDKFIEPIIKFDLSPNEFHKVYRENFKLLSTEYAINEDNVMNIDEDDNEEQISANLSTISKFILVAAYIASFNSSKHDWLLFSKNRDLKKYRSSPKKKPKLSSKSIEASAFDMERLLAITHSIYESVHGKKLESNVDLTTQIADLSSLNLLLKSQNQDYISAKVKWKANVTHEFIQPVAYSIGFRLEDYLTE
jgi:origin recognition complex subunit 5